MFLYTEKDLVDVLPLREKTFAECGINTTNIEVICLKEGTFAFLEVENLEKYNKYKLEDLVVQTLDEREQRISELKEKYDKEVEEAYKKTDKYKISVLENDIKITQAAVDFILMSNEKLNVLNIINLGDGNMGAYFASRIMKKALKYEDVIKKYPEFKDDIDFILKSEGYGDIVENADYNMR